MLRFFKIDQGIIRDITLQPDTPPAELVATANWIDAHDPTDEERELISGLLRIDLPESDEVNEIEDSARYFIDSAGLHVHSLYLSPSEGRYTTETVAFILQTNRLISIREADIVDFRLFRLRARKEQIVCANAQALFITLLEQKVENHADYLEDIHFQLEKVSYAVLEEGNTEYEACIDKLARLEDSNGKTRLCLMDAQRDISFLIRHLKTEKSQDKTLREITRDINTLMSHSTFLFDKINFLMNSTQGFINIQQSQIIKIFSIAAVVFLPPTLVASIYGMNFKHMPELDWLLGYPWAIGLMILAGFAPYFYFKRKGWL